jgi:hypothetical protein
MTRALDHHEWFDLLDGAKNDLPVIHTLLSNLHGYKTQGYDPADLNADVKQIVHLMLALRLHQMKVLRKRADEKALAFKDT